MQSICAWRFDNSSGARKISPKLSRPRIVPAKPNFERHSARISHGKENGVVQVGRVGNLAAQPHLFLATR
ncbi:MAG: hypothetical protein DME71_05950 [Verrucomicrobia bacterium]|nr:MAG: hypothetical protein DME92_05910 [Verrucomicrobiota bacterium]PYJ90478.1 MAG: hypothetical protein DME71_05950 [Verrucomicrobiota bacterium]